jgi:hypothetical protein
MDDGQAKAKDRSSQKDRNDNMGYESVQIECITTKRTLSIILHKPSGWHMRYPLHLAQE